MIAHSSPLKKWKKGVRSKFSVRDFSERIPSRPKIGPDPDFFNGLIVRLFEFCRERPPWRSGE